jgi:hypothetical protein
LPAVDLKSFLEIFPYRDPPDYGIAYGLCMMNLMNELGHAVEDHPEYVRVALIHDHGDWDELAYEGFYRLKDDPKWRHRDRFLGITPLSSYADIGLQCADLFAYESMRYLDEHGWEGRDMRKPLKALLHLMDDASIFALYLNRQYLERMRDHFSGTNKNENAIPEVR